MEDIFDSLTEEDIRAEAPAAAKPQGDIFDSLTEEDFRKEPTPTEPQGDIFDSLTEEDTRDTAKIRSELYKMLGDESRVSGGTKREIADPASGFTGEIAKKGKNALGAVAGALGEGFESMLATVTGGALGRYNEESGSMNAALASPDLRAAHEAEMAEVQKNQGQANELTRRDAQTRADTIGKFIQYFEGNGVTDGKQMASLLQDSIKEREWDSSSNDNARVLSDGELRVNPKFVAMPDANAGVQAINSSTATPEEKAAATRTFLASRKIAAQQFNDKLLAYDEGDYREHVAKKKAEGITDPEQVFYSWDGLNRGWAKKSWDVVRDTVAEAGRGLYRTAFEVGQGIDAGLAKTGRALGAENFAKGREAEVARAGRDILASAEKSGYASDLGEARGERGAVSGTLVELGSSVGQMAPMVAGGVAGGAVKNTATTTAKALLGDAIQGLSVYGMAGAQGYGSLMQTALETAQQKARAEGRGDLTDQEIVKTVNDFQGAAMANGFQTAIMAKLMPGGSERAALGVAGEMTVKDVLTQFAAQRSGSGVTAALRALKPELTALAKTFRHDVADEALEEGANQYVEGLITRLSGADPDKTWDQIGQETWKGTWQGGIVGGGMPLAMGAFQRSEAGQAELDAAEQASLDLATSALPDAPEAAAAALEPVEAPLTEAPQETAATEQTSPPTDESPLPQQPASEAPPSDSEVPTSEVVTPPPVQQAPVETSPAPTGLEPTESLPEGTTPSAVTEGVGVPEQIPLGLDRQPVVDLTLQDLEDGDLETHRKQVYRNLDSLERQLDEAEDFGEALMADRNFATQLAEAQDAYNAVGNEKFRRDMMVAEPEDVAYEFRQLKPRVNTDKAKMAILFDVIGRRGLKDQMRPYFEAYANRSPDHAEQLAGMMEDAGQVLKEMQQASPAEAPAISEVEETRVRKINFNGEDRWEVQTDENRERTARGERELGGNVLYGSFAEAEAAVKSSRELERRNMEFRTNQQAQVDKETAQQEEADAPLNRYVDSRGGTPMQSGATRTALSQVKRLRHTASGKVYEGPRHQVIREMLADGWGVEQTEAPAIKEPSRATWNRMDNRQQEAFRKKREAAGMKTEHRITLADGDFFDITKTEYDYAKWLESNPDELKVEKKPEASAKPPLSTRAIQARIEDGDSIPADQVSPQNLELVTQAGYVRQGDLYIQQPTETNGQDTQRQPGPETPAEAPQTQSPLEGGPATDQAGVEGAVDAPDWADLNDWVFENYPQEYEASRYLNPGSQYGFHVKLWEMAGRPKIGSEPVPLSGEAPKATAGVSETPPYTPEEGAATGQAVFEGSVEESPLPTQEAQPHDPEKQTSLKNAATDADLQALGFDPILKPESRPHERVMNEAREAYDLDPGAASRLITEITQKPRVLSDFEDGLLKIELANRKIAQGKAQQAYFQAVESGANEETQANARAYLDELREGTFKAIVAAKMAGTEWGRAGAFRRRNINHDDWSLAAMEARFRIDALDGGKLTPAQEKLIAEMAEKIREADARSGIFDEAAMAEEEGDTKKADSLMELARLVDAHTSDIAQAQKKLEARNRAPRRRQQIKELLDPKIEAARARIAARNAALVENLTDTTKLHAAIGSPEFFADLKDYAIIFSAKFVDVAMAIDQFRAEVVAELGDWIKPHIPELFRMSRAFYYENAASVDGDNSPTRESVLDGVDSEAPLDKRDVWALARAHIIEGLRGNNVLDAVVNDLSAKFPELTRDQVAEIYTDYGKTIYPNKNEATKELNRIRNIERIVLQLKDIREGRMPKRTGFQRGERDVEVRELNKQLREALRDSSLQVTDPEKQLQSALGATKRRMSNEIEELQRALDRKQPRTTDARQPVQLDEEGLQLKSKLEAKRKEYAEAFGEGISRERRIAATLKSLDRQIAEEAQLLKDGILKKTRTEPVSTPEIEARRDKLREMRAHRRELYAAQNPLNPLEQAKKAAIEAGGRLQQMIDSGDVAVRRKEPVQPDAELSALWDANEALRDQIAEMRKALPLTEGEVKAAVEKQITAAEKTAAKIQAKLDSGDLSVEARPLGQRTAAVASDPRVQQVRAQIKQLNKELAARRRAALPKLSPEEARLKRVLQYAERAKKDLTRRIAARDVTPKERPTPLNSPEARKARRDVNTLKRKFNEIVLEEGLKNAPSWKKAGRLAIDIPLRLPRAVMASLDVSGIGRQSWSVIMTRPGLAVSQFPKHFAFTEDAADRHQAELEEHPDFELAESAGLALQSWRPGHALHEMEEAYRSRLAKKIPLVAHSERAYVTYLNGVRMAYFTEMVKLLRARPDGLTQANLKALATFVNNMTGRGNLGKYEKSMDVLSDALFSPRYVSSRFQLLAGMAINPLQLLTGYRLGPKESRIARQLIGREYTRLTVGASLLFGLLAFAASAFGGDGEDEKFSFSLDPLSSDFGKIKIGEMRIDVGGGMIQPLVFLSRFATGKKHGADGVEIELRGPLRDQGQSLGRLTTQFARSKFSPMASLLTDWAFQEDLYGRPAYTSENLISMYIPLPVAETYENYRKMGFGGATVAGMASFVGLGTSAYGAQTDENYRSSAGKDLNTSLTFPIIDFFARPFGKEVDPNLYEVDPDDTEFLIDR